MTDAGSPASLRGDHARLTAWAKEAYARGSSVHDVVTAVYGVDLPAEAYAFYDSHKQQAALPVELFFFPWELLQLADPAHEEDSAGPWALAQELNALNQNPDFLPLMQLVGDESLHNGYVIGYSLEQLKQGSTTVMGHQEDIPESGASFETVGPSLLVVLHEWASDHLKLVTAQVRAPSNRDFGSLTTDDVQKAKDLLAVVEALQADVEKS